MMKSAVSLCMIVRNEERNLAECLAQVAGLVDEIVVVDSGSTDHTREVASAHGARVVDFPWCDDFSAARNEALRHARGPWILWLDADDRLDEENRRRLGGIVAGLNGRQVGYAMHCTSVVETSDKPPVLVTHLRLFPAAAGLRWRGRVHERLMQDDSGRALELVVSGVTIRHCGYEDGATWRKKLQRNLRLLQLDFALDPDNAQTLFYLGWSHRFLGNLAASEPFLRRSLRRDPHQREAYRVLAKALLSDGRAVDAAEVCRAGLREFPDDRELLYCFAKMAADQNEAESADLVSDVRLLLGAVYQRKGRFVESEQQYLAILKMRPGFVCAWVGLGELYLRLGRWPQFDAANARLAALPSGRLLAQVQWARLHLVRQEYAQSRRLLEDVLAEEPTLVWPRTVLLELLRLEGADVEQQLRLAKEILTLDPAYALVRTKLEELERHHNLRESSALRPTCGSPVSASCVVIAGQ
jgi:glycosyltransferase involved in cell wall biosynthesis